MSTVLIFFRKRNEQQTMSTISFLFKVSFSRGNDRFQKSSMRFDEIFNDPSQKVFSFHLLFTRKTIVRCQSSGEREIFVRSRCWNSTEPYSLFAMFCMIDGREYKSYNHSKYLISRTLAIYLRLRPTSAIEFVSFRINERTWMLRIYLRISCHRVVRALRIPLNAGRP